MSQIKILKFIDANTAIVDIINDTNNPIKINDIFSLEKLDNQDIKTKMRALWFVLLRYLSSTTGYSEFYWSILLQTVTFTIQIFEEENGQIIKIPKSLSNNSCSCNDLHNLLNGSITWLIDNDINISDFQQKYFDLTQKELF